MTGLLLPKPTKRLPSERKRVSKVSKRPSAKDRAIADRLCAALVKQRAGNKCEAVGEMGIECSRTLDWAHGRNRRWLSVRWAHANTWALCRAHHEVFGNSWSWHDFRVVRLGAVTFNAVQRLSLQLAPVDMSEVIANLKRGVTQMERA